MNESGIVWLMSMKFCLLQAASVIRRDRRYQRVISSLDSVGASRITLAFSVTAARSVKFLQINKKERIETVDIERTQKL